MRHLMTKEARLAARWRPEGCVDEIKEGNAVCWITPASSEKQMAIAYRGTAAKAAFWHVFKTREQMLKHVNDWLQAVRKEQESRKTYRRAIPKTVDDVYAKALKDPFLDDTDVAVLLRHVLAERWPDTKFSVRVDRYSMGSHVDVFWQDGPTTKEVEEVADQYEFKRFDGSIDLGYSVSQWLHKNGTMSIAHDPGTGESRGVNSEHIGDPRDGSAVPVKGGTDYVNCHRNVPAT